MMHSYLVSHAANRAEKPCREASNRELFSGRKTRFGEETEAKKRMFNLPNRNLIENKGILEDRTGPNRRFEPEMVRNQLNLQ